MTRLFAFSLALVALLALSACGAGSEEVEPLADTVAAEATPDVARLICKPGRTQLETPTVKPQADGVHVEIVNEGGAELAVAFTAADIGTGFPARAGTSTQIVDLGPGTLDVSCSDPSTEPGGGQPLEIVDEDGVWVSPELACGETFSQVLDYIQGAKGESSDPLEAARKGLEGYELEPSDEFVRVGYPEAATARVGLVRDGQKLAVVDLFDDGSGAWLVGMITGCSSLQTG